MFTLSDGELAVKIARKTIESQLAGAKPPAFDVPKHFAEKSGVFVTLTTHPRHDLRGCIGFPEPVFPLVQAVEDAARSAAFRDPRFPPLRTIELARIVVEVSLLSQPEPVRFKKPTELLELVKVGRDGLIMEKGPFRGLLLPQVPVEQGWDVERFLAHTCLKSGMSSDCWIDKNVRVFKFTAQVFSEKSPNGPVVERSL